MTKREFILEVALRLLSTSYTKEALLESATEYADFYEKEGYFEEETGK